MSTYYVTTTTWNPGAITDLNLATKDVTVTGAALGDMVRVALVEDVIDLQLTATVVSANNVTAVLTNSGVGSPNLADGTIYVVVESRSGQHIS